MHSNIIFLQNYLHFTKMNSSIEKLLRPSLTTSGYASDSYLGYKLHIVYWRVALFSWIPKNRPIIIWLRVIDLWVPLNIGLLITLISINSFLKIINHPSRKECIKNPRCRFVWERMKIQTANSLKPVIKIIYDSPRLKPSYISPRLTTHLVHMKYYSEIFGHFRQIKRVKNIKYINLQESRIVFKIICVVLSCWDVAFTYWRGK